MSVKGTEDNVEEKMPLKDLFSSDESDPISEREEKVEKSVTHIGKIKKVRKEKLFRWALKWVKVKNIV